ncbi:MAG: DNA repair exonuclease [Rhodospirillales bacterium]|nr:DNA repair exonuclease [Rhodospirillales bacterium]
MSPFRFVHAADLHLDSPLIGLRRRAEGYAGRIETASRAAFDNLIALAIDEGCRLLLIAGDVFDGQWRDYRTGLFFADRMGRLRKAGVAVVMIAGNHDAENRFAAGLPLTDNARLLSSRAPETVVFDDIGVAVHGQSFPQRDVRENIARAYPPPLDGRFNIGLLHSACTGRDGHEPYAPCTVEQLAAHGYQYWALGHVHAHEILASEPPIVFSGNLQGRSIRETGVKGAMLVAVDDGQVSRIEHRPLDLVRWAVERVSIAGIAERTEVLIAVSAAVERALAAADGRGLAVRLRLIGATPLHAELAATEAALGEEIETLVAGLGDDVWIERIELRTAPPPFAGKPIDPSLGGRLRRCLADLAADPWLAERLQVRVNEVRAKVPAGARVDALIAELDSEALEAAQALAAAMIEHGGA